jgi:hypothetical protein
VDSGGRDQEDYCLKPAQANSSRDPVQKKPSTKKKKKKKIEMVEWLNVKALSSSPRTAKKKKKERTWRDKMSKCEISI